MSTLPKQIWITTDRALENKTEPVYCAPWLAASKTRDFEKVPSQNVSIQKTRYSLQWLSLRIKSEAPCTAALVLEDLVCQRIEPPTWCQEWMKASTSGRKKTSSTVDANCGYWQVEIYKMNRDKTAFCLTSIIISIYLHALWGWEF